MRRARLVELKRCLRCSRQGHIKLADCPFKTYTCQPGGHKLDKKQAPEHVELLLKQDRLYAEADSELDYGSEVGTNYGDDYDEQTAQMINTVTIADHHVMQASSDEHVLLMATELDVFNPQDPAQQCSCPVFFDQGSTATLMTKDLAQKLNLPIKEEKVLAFHGLADAPAGKQTTLKVTAEAVDSLCAPKPKVALSCNAIQRVISKAHLPLPAAVVTPQILVGTDYFGEFDIIRRKKKLANGFFVYDSLVGPLLSGKGKDTWRIDPQARPDSRQQDPHKLNAIAQDQPSQLEERRHLVKAFNLDRDGDVHSVRLKLKGGAVENMQVRYVCPFGATLLDSESTTADALH
ncbi:Zinc knuckle family protein [Aphelenchoides avenae]|nr:Zinc knuckle family protein [Aphelenchus avenae]